LPNIPFNLEILVKLKREAALRKLHRPFQSDSSWSKDEMKVVRQDYEFMQQVLLLLPVIQQNLNEEPRDLVDLEKASLLQDIGCYKIGRFTNHTAMGNGQAVPQWLKPAYFNILTAGLEGLLHPLNPPDQRKMVRHSAKHQAWNRSISR
jgi:hypothetical protein